MALKARKLEHSGAKKGRVAFYGRKVEAKRASNHRRRAADKDAARERGPSQAQAPEEPTSWLPHVQAVEGERIREEPSRR